MTAWSALARGAAPLRVALLVLDEGGLALAGMLTPLRLLAQQVGAARFTVTVVRCSSTELPGSALAGIDKNVHLAMLVADSNAVTPSSESIRELAQICQQACFWGALGAPVLWLACAGKLARVRSALPWACYAEINEVGEQAILVPNLFELDGQCLTCCGGTASIDLALTLIALWFGAELQADIMEALCVEQVRQGDERQRIALQTRFGVLQPQLSEAVALMENNIEETLSTDDIAQLVGLSRRQLERQFRQYLGTMPSRYYLELRLKKARQMLLESNSSIVQIGLMCGFSSGAHFSTAFGTQFGITPRGERQRKMNAASFVVTR